MNLYLDTEFNGHGGKVISLAIASPTGENFYGLWNLVTLPELHPWVKEHVLPVLSRTSRDGPPASFPTDPQRALQAYLLHHPGAHIYADWPADFSHFLECLTGPTFEQALNYQCTMHLIQTPPGEPVPEVPHNALSDAIALMKWHQSR